MRIRLRKDSFLFDRRIDSDLDVDYILARELLSESPNDKISLYARGDGTSGILTFSRSEAERIIEDLRGKIDSLKREEKGKQENQKQDVPLHSKGGL